MLGKRDLEIPVYLVTGFMDSGKTTFIKETLDENDFGKKSRVLIIMCEDGEEEYDEIELKKKYNANLVEIASEDEFTREKMDELEAKYEPHIIFVEYNGTWKYDTIGDEGKLPDNWQLVQIMSLVDATTFDSYLQNMRSMIFENLFLSDLIIINRCTDDTPKQKYRQNIKSINRKVQIAYERSDGTIEQGGDDGVPFDISGDFIKIPETDYGLWYLDLHDHPEKYVDKTIEFLSVIYNGEGTKDEYFAAGRFAMTCCADDIQFLGLKCFYDKSKELENKSWAVLTAKVFVDYDPDVKDEVPMIKFEKIEAASEPEDHLVYFS